MGCPPGGFHDVLVEWSEFYGKHEIGNLDLDLLGMKGRHQIGRFANGRTGFARRLAISRAYESVDAAGPVDSEARNLTDSDVPLHQHAGATCCTWDWGRDRVVHRIRLWPLHLPEVA